MADEREQAKEAQQKRADKYGIAPKEGKPVTKPAKFADVAEADFGDPVNWSYPADAEHARAALGYFNQDGQREDGGYSAEEWAVIGKRLAERVSRHLDAGYEFSDGKLRRKKEGEKAINLTQRLENIRQAFNAQYNTPSNYEYWVRDVYDEFVIVVRERVEEGTQTYQVAYSEQGDGSFEFAPRAEWIEGE